MVWVQAYIWAWGLPRTTASDVFTLQSCMEYLRPVLTQELCRHLHWCLKHEDVARQLTLRDLNLACEQWVCNSPLELTEEMDMWKWDREQGNKWARVAKCSQMLNIPIEMPGAPEGQRGTSWARATRELRRLRHRIEAVEGSMRLEYGTCRRSNGVYCGLESRLSGRLCPTFWLQDTTQ